MKQTRCGMLTGSAETKLERHAAFFSGACLLVSCAYIAVEAVGRLQSPDDQAEKLDGYIMLISSTIAVSATSEATHR